MRLYNWLVLFGAALAAPVDAAPLLHGRVVKVSDGDTLTVLDAGQKQHKIRLAQIDAPEKNQAFGEKSRQNLAALVAGRNVEVSIETTDRYGRSVGRVQVDGQNANLQQVQAGMAWAYRQYLTDPAYAAAEAEAKRAKRGLWADPSPVPPWQFRHSDKPVHAGPVPNSWVPPWEPPEECDRSKRRCRDMSNCQEARFYLQECGVQSLDNDRDGIPCEAACR